MSLASGNNCNKQNFPHHSLTNQNDRAKLVAAKRIDFNEFKVMSLVFLFLTVHRSAKYCTGDHEQPECTALEELIKNLRPVYTMCFFVRLELIVAH